jgi:hypothetical protein
MLISILLVILKYYKKFCYYLIYSSFIKKNNNKLIELKKFKYKLKKDKAIQCNLLDELEDLVIL